MCLSVASVLSTSALYNNAGGILRTFYRASIFFSFRLRFVFEKVGVSMTITSITNVLGFALGCIAPAPEIQLFCAAVAIAMLLDLLYQVDN